MIRVLSLGAGVQSTTLALMAEHGEFGDKPVAAIFADTKWEPKRVYDHLAFLRSANVLSYPIYIVSAGDLRQDIMNHRHPTAENYRAVPWFIKNPDGSEGMGKRQCTKEYKLTPIRRKVRELLGGKTPKGGAEMWIGISTDEIFRVKPSQVGYMTNRWPLIEKRMNRNDCMKWLERNGYPTPPKSSCIGCPYHNNQQWRDLKANPDEWKDAVEVDAAIRNQPGFRGTQFMHRSLVPLEQVDLRTDAEVGQPDLFNNDCEGMCGV